MEIRFANTGDIPRMIDLLQQVGEVHHQIRPDLFRAGAQKYDEEALKKLLADPSRPIVAGVVDGKMVGYAFCILQDVKNDPVRGWLRRFSMASWTMPNPSAVMPSP